MIVAQIRAWAPMDGRNPPRAQQWAELWQLRVKTVWAKGVGLSEGLKQWSESVFPICKEVLKQTFLF